MDVESEEKKTRRSVRRKIRKDIDMEDTINYLQKYLHNYSLKQEELLLQKENIYKRKFMNISSTKCPKTSTLDLQHQTNVLKTKN